jgi:hypothetical protein
MITFLVERAIPPAFDTADPENVALHARWAVEAYRKVGAFWLGGVVTDKGMFSLVTVEKEEDLHAYGRSLGFDPEQMVLRRVIRPLGPWYAMDQSSARPPRLR